MYEKDELIILKYMYVFSWNVCDCWNSTFIFTLIINWIYRKI